MLLSKILKTNPDNINLMYINDIDFSSRNADIPLFFDIQKLSEKIPNFNTLFIERISEFMKYRGDDLYEILSSENDDINKYGLGFSKGSEKATRKGANSDKIKKFIELAVRISENLDKSYLHYGLMKRALKGLGRDGISDMIINLMPDVFEKENNNLILGLRRFETFPSGLLIKDIEPGSKGKVVQFGGVGKYLSNSTWTSHFYEISEEEKLIDFSDEILKRKNDDKTYSFSNEEARNFLQKLVTIPNIEVISEWKSFLELNANAVTLRMALGDKFESVLAKIFTHKTNEITIKNLVEYSLNKSSKITPTEDYVSNAIKAILKARNTLFTEEVHTPIGNIDIHISNSNSLIELKVHDESATESSIHSNLRQLFQYSNQPSYRTSSLTLVLYINRKKHDDIIKYINSFSEEVGKGKKCNIIIYHWNYHTASNMPKDYESLIEFDKSF